MRAVSKKLTLRHGIAGCAFVVLLAGAVDGCAQDLEVGAASSISEMSASGAPSHLLSYVTGGFRFESSYRIDNDARKSMFPYLDGDLLVFLEIEPEGGTKRALAYEVTDLIGATDDNQPVPIWSYRERPTAFGVVVPQGQGEKILAVLPGPSLVTTEDGGRLLPTRQGPPLSDGTIHDFLPGDPPALVTPEGFFVGGTSFFACREVMRVDGFEGWYAVGYKDYENRSAVCLLRKPVGQECGCDPLPGVSEYAPAFSGDGRFLAVAAGTAERSSLRVYRRSGSKVTLVLEREPLKHYDATNRDFSYRGSFRWLGNDLFFLENSTEGAVILRARCESRDCQVLERLDPPACLSLERLPSIQETENPIWLSAAGCLPSSEAAVIGRMDLKSVEWMQPFRIAEKTYLATESVLEFQYPQKDIPIWVTRILIFRLA